MTKVKQEWTKISPFFDFLLHVSIFLLEILNIASQLSCKAMLKISCGTTHHPHARANISQASSDKKFKVKIIKNVGENRRKGQSWSYLDGPFLL